MSHTPADVVAGLGGDTFVSGWVEVTQELTDRFADATRDPDWMHVDPERAARDGPFEGTIAFGFWTLSMLTWFLRDATGREYPDGASYGFNYGLDRVRLTAPVPIGARIRNHLTITRVEERGPGRFLVTTHNRVEVEGEEKPAMVADWLVMFVYPEGA